MAKISKIVQSVIHGWPKKHVPIHAPGGAKGQSSCKSSPRLRRRPEFDLAQSDFLSHPLVFYSLRAAHVPTAARSTGDPGSGTISAKAFIRHLLHNALFALPLHAVPAHAEKIASDNTRGWSIVYTDAGSSNSCSAFTTFTDQTMIQLARVQTPSKAAWAIFLSNTKWDSMLSGRAQLALSLVANKHWTSTFSVATSATGDKRVSVTILGSSPADTRESVHIHLHYVLFDEILKNLAKTASAFPPEQVAHHDLLRDAAKALHLSLIANPGDDVSKLTPEEEVRLLHIFE